MQQETSSLFVNYAKAEGREASLNIDLQGKWDGCNIIVSVEEATAIFNALFKCLYARSSSDFEEYVWNA